MFLFHLLTQVCKWSCCVLCRSRRIVKFDATFCIRVQCRYRHRHYQNFVNNICRLERFVLKLPDIKVVVFTFRQQEPKLCPQLELHRLQASLADRVDPCFKLTLEQRQVRCPGSEAKTKLPNNFRFAPVSRHFSRVERSQISLYCGRQPFETTNFLCDFNNLLTCRQRIRRLPVS